jgi:hypothetical protein
MPSSGRRHHASRPAWLVGLVAGGLSALLLLSWGIGLPFLALVTFLVGALAPPRPIGLSGTLLGLAIGLGLLVGLATLRCSGDAACTQPDLLPVAAFTVSVALAGVVVGLVARRRPGREARL